VRREKPSPFRDRRQPITVLIVDPLAERFAESAMEVLIVTGWNGRLALVEPHLDDNE
jgi:hypothetical protein